MIRYHKIILDAAKKYNDNLVNKNMLVIHYNRTTKQYIKTEFIFRKSNFLHFTGVDYKESTVNNKKSVLFFNKCIHNELSINDYKFRKDGTTRLKLDILFEIVNIHKTATMIGDYNKSRPQLMTDKLYGNTRASIGTISIEKDYYIPNTVLKEGIRDIVTKWHPIKAIYLKRLEEEAYSISNSTNVSKDFDINALHESIRKLIF